MTFFTKTFIRSLNLIFSISFLNLLTPASTFAEKKVVDKIIATVNSDAVLQSDLKNLEERLGDNRGVDETLLLDDSVADLKKNKKSQLDFLIREKLVDSEIKRQNLSITNERVEMELNQMAKKNGLSRSEFDSYVTKQGISLEDYKEFIKSRIERQSFFENEIISKLRITDEDAYSEYQTKNPKYKPNVNEFTIAQIYFNPRKTGGPEAALKRAEAVLERIKNGEQYETLADKFNEDGSGNPGGLLGSFKTGEFNPEIEAAISNLKEGEITSIVQTKRGYHIVKVISKKITTDPNFVKVKDAIKAQLVEKNFKRQLKNWIETKKQDSYITIYE